MELYLLSFILLVLASQFLPVETAEDNPCCIFYLAYRRLPWHFTVESLG